jgi:hypothetical protein
VWQELREELFPKGLEIVTVALDLRGVETAGPFIEAAAPRHPSLIDRGHVVDELFGIVNVPMGVWIDETGTIVRPAEPAYPRRPDFLNRGGRSENLTPAQLEQIQEVRKIRIEPEKYVAALRDWAEHGSASRFALAVTRAGAAQDLVRRERSEAAAHFELAQHLWLTGPGGRDGAIEHFRAAHRLQPDNWTYRRQAWMAINGHQGPSDVFEGDWLTDVKKIGAENYYAPLDM